MSKSLLLVIALTTSLSLSNVAFAQNTGGVFGPTVNQGHKSLQYRGAINPDNNFGETGFAQRLHYQQAINGDFMWRILGLFWELSGNDDKHKTGLRFDARLRGDNRAEQLGLNWMNQFNFDGGWSARASGHTLGVELYNNYGNTGNIRSFNEQSHTIGPFISTSIAEKTSVFAGPLFGLSEAAPDLEARIWITQGF